MQLQLILIWALLIACVSSQSFDECTDTLLPSSCRTIANNNECEVAGKTLCKKTCGACTASTGFSVSPSSRLFWEKVGEDRFVYFSEVLRWDAAEESCKNYGLKLYEPKDALRLASYIGHIYGGEALPFLGGRGDGQVIRWRSNGVVVGRDQPWGDWGTTPEYDDVGSDKCMYLVTYSFARALGTVLSMDSCTITGTYLCG